MRHDPTPVVDERDVAECSGRPASLPRLSVLPIPARRRTPGRTETRRVTSQLRTDEVVALIVSVAIARAAQTVAFAAEPNARSPRSNKPSRRPSPRTADVQGSESSSVFPRQSGRRRIPSIPLSRSVRNGLLDDPVARLPLPSSGRSHNPTPRRTSRSPGAAAGLVRDRLGLRPWGSSPVSRRSHQRPGSDRSHFRRSPERAGHRRLPRRPALRAVVTHRRRDGVRWVIPDHRLRQPEGFAPSVDLMVSRVWRSGERPRRCTRQGERAGSGRRAEGSRR